MMKHLTAILITICAAFTTCTSCLAQNAGYVYQYHYGIVNEAAFMPSMDSDLIGKKFLENNIANTTISGAVYTNGTLLLLSLNADNVKDAETFAGNTITLDMNVAHDTDHDQYIFYSPTIVVQIGKGDTTCQAIDASIKFTTTGNTRKIAQWDCTEYKSSLDDYHYISIWASSAIPAAVNIGVLSGVTGGIAEIENKDKNIKITLTAYKKLPQAIPCNIYCTDQETHTFRFADIFK